LEERAGIEPRECREGLLEVGAAASHRADDGLVEPDDGLEAEVVVSIRQSKEEQRRAGADCRSRL
jgi:hypothetical protein